MSYTYINHLPIASRQVPYFPGRAAGASIPTWAALTRVPNAGSWQWRIAPQRRAGVPLHINPDRPAEVIRSTTSNGYLATAHRYVRTIPNAGGCGSRDARRARAAAGLSRETGIEQDLAGRKSAPC